MATSIIPFESAKTDLAPAILADIFGTTSDLLGNNAGGGFPVISIKGKVFHIQRGDERTLITKPGEDDPAASLEVVIVKANPNRSKVFYSSGYQEGSVEKPTCYSNNGIAPEADAQEPQASKCAVCPHNQWGSRVTDNGGKGKACSDSRRLAIATVDAPNDPMLLRVPAASMKAMEEYAKMLATRGLPYQAVVTKIGFDYSVAHPALTFKGMGMIGDKALLQQIKESGESEIVQQITGLKPMPRTQSEANEAVAPAAEKAAKTEAAVEAAVATATKTKKATVVAEAAPAPKAAAPKAEPKVATAAALDDELSSLIEDLNFDD